MSSRLRSLNSTKISFFAFQDIITSVSGILILVTLILATELDSPTSRAAHDADPELERRLSETLLQQVEVDAQNQQLQELLAAAETAPAPEKLETDITRLRTQLAEETQKHASVAEQLAAIQSAIEARDRTLGLTDLKAQIQRIIQEAESLARQEAKVREQMARLEQRVAGVQSKLLKLREREGKLWLIPDKRSTTKEPILVTVSAAGAKIERFDQPDQTKQLGSRRAKSDFESFLHGAKPLDQYFVFLVRPSGIELFEQLVKSARDNGFEVGFDALEEDKNIYFAAPPIIDDTTPTQRHVGPLEQPGSGGYSDPRGGAGDVVGSDVRGRGAPSPGAGSGVPTSSNGRKGLSAQGNTAGGGSRGNAREGFTEPSVAPPDNTAGRINLGGAPGNSPSANQGQLPEGRGTAGTGTSAEAGEGKGTSEQGSPSVGEKRGAGKGEGQDSSVSTQSKETPTTPPAQPASPPPPKTKSWWQRFLEWIGLK